jgi:hypothetical protein
MLLMAYAVIGSKKLTHYCTRLFTATVLFAIILFMFFHANTLIGHLIVTIRTNGSSSPQRVSVGCRWDYVDEWLRQVNSVPAIRQKQDKHRDCIRCRTFSPIFMLDYNFSTGFHKHEKFFENAIAKRQRTRHTHMAVPICEWRFIPVHGRLGV